jgi:tetratricopeptide (TPR) repeat protein
MKMLLASAMGLAVILSFRIGAQPAPSRNGYHLFQQGLVKERAEGKLEQAIQLYQRVIREFGGDRALAARAWLQTGRCYEKLGKPEARQAYERIVREYPEQREVAKQARRRLGSLRGSAAAWKAKASSMQI